jgi:hypothetical protein
MSNFLIDDDTNLLAAEFVLGTLDSEERANAQSLLRIDHRFIAMVRIWERRLGELHLMVEPIEPGPEMLARIKAKLAQLPPEEGPAGAPSADARPTPGPKVPEAAKPAEAANLAETSGPEAAAAAAARPVETLDGPASVTADAAPSGPETLAPAASPPAPASEAEPAAGKAEPVEEVRSPETVLRSERGAEPRAAEAPSLVPPPFPSLAPPKLPDKPAEFREDEREVTTRMVRSRGRWRAFSVLLLLVVVAIGGLVAAWRFAPERVPPALQPTQIMTAIGIGSPPPPAARPTPGAFDE